MNRETTERLINKLLSTGADFSEIYEEKTEKKTYGYLDSKLDKISYSSIDGVGLRIAKNNEIYYGSTNNIDEVDALADELISNVNEPIIYKDIKLDELEKYEMKCKSIKDSDESIIKEYMSSLDKKVRSKDSRISQVGITIMFDNKDITIANYHGLYKNEKRHYACAYIHIMFKDKDLNSTSYISWHINGNLELLDKDLDELIDNAVKYGIDKLYAKNCVGKVMPVILAKGEGAVIFHEACGHAMEASATSKNQSVLAGKIGEKVASDKVTIIDDGSLEKKWGSTIIDDEGIPTRKNIMIENGILKNNFNDEINNRLLNLELTGSSRRQNYRFAPVSRMNNTYLKPGTDKIEDMIKSIDFGLYAVELGGGSVDTETGKFNFACDTAYMIRDGKIAECVKGATLIGNALDILKNVEMVSDDFAFTGGNCGASSGWVHVTMGQPTIKISNILVGGESDD